MQLSPTSPLLGTYHLTTDLSKTEKITDRPTPQNVQEVQQFLGLAGKLLLNIHPELCWDSQTIAPPD